MHQSNNTPSDLNIPREAQVRDRVVMLLVYADEFKAIEDACVEQNVSRSSLLYAILREATENFKIFTAPPGAKLRRRKRIDSSDGDC